jgi:hypothetical protein
MPQGSHFWTTDAGAEGLPQPMWTCDGLVFHVLSGPPDQLPAGAVPLYRFCDAEHERHFWTLDPGGESLPKPDFRLDQIVGHVFPTPQPGTVPLYRWHSLHEGRHFWTTDVNGEQMPRPPYRLESEVCHVYPRESPPASRIAPVYRWRNTLGLHEWQVDIYRVTGDSSGSTRQETIARKSVLADDWSDVLAKANQLFNQHQPADGYHLIDGHCANPL